MTTQGRASGPANGGGALAPLDSQPMRAGAAGIREFLERSRSQIAAALPKHLTVERMLRVAMTAIQTTPDLQRCTPLSLIGGVVLFSQLGLEIGGPLGQAHLVPYRKRGRDGEPDTWIATPIPGYRGMVDLARRSGAVSTIEAHVVKKRDRFRFAFGLRPTLEHTPYAGEDDPGPSTHVYAICRLRDGSTQYDVLTRREVEHVRKRSQAAGSEYSPWNTDPDEMWKKTAIRRLWKLLPVSVERSMEKAIVAHDAAERGEPLDPSGVLVEGSDLFSGSPEPEAPAERRTTKRAPPVSDAERTESPPQDDAPPRESAPARTPPQTERGRRIAFLAELREKEPDVFEQAFQLSPGTGGRLDLARAKDADLQIGVENAESVLRHRDDPAPPAEDAGGDREPGDDRDQDPPQRRTSGRR